MVPRKAGACSLRTGPKNTSGGTRIKSMKKSARGTRNKPTKKSTGGKRTKQMDNLPRHNAPTSWKTPPVEEATNQKGRYPAERDIKATRRNGRILSKRQLAEDTGALPLPTAFPQALASAKALTDQLNDNIKRDDASVSSALTLREEHALRSDLAARRRELLAELHKALDHLRL